MEAQQADAAEKSSQRRPTLNPQQAALRRDIETLRLTRASILQQLAKSRDPRHRQLLEESLSELERKIQALSPEGPVSH